MKLHLNTSIRANIINAHGEGYVTVNGLRIEHALIVMADKLIDPWLISSTEQPTLENFTDLIALRPELVVFGSGHTFRFPDRRIMAAFSNAKIGFEVMDTPAACRTYNVLISEGRNVAAALLI